MADTNDIKSPTDLAQDALDETASSSQAMGGDDELTQSNELAETLGSLQNVIERNALELERLRSELKEKRESMQSVFENNVQLAEVEDAAQAATEEVKKIRSALKASPQVTSLNNDTAELKERIKETEETLNNHLLSYYGLTNSMSFDTSEGDQWDFSVKAKLKSRK